MTSTQAQAHPDFTQLFWDKAADQAMDIMGTEFVRLAPLVHGVISPEANLDPARLFVPSGRVLQTMDPQTGEYRQKATFKAVFSPEKAMAGQIIRLEDDRAIASMKDRITVRLFSTNPITTPAYFLIAEPITGHGPDFLKVIGWGKIIQSLQKPMHTAQATTGSLCLAQIEESSKEVQRDDIIFLLEISATAMQPVTPAVLPTATGQDTVIVTPQWEPEPIKPAETK
ncbi:hypothetical protein DPF_2527 [Desulfoplanes formicivorans]|uniref:Uncharacterized protein n=2 Tax=Desulfoplanes formicivorans TaxID=1592317 RepID=A0A194AMC9_9BACT|nr:hypothetical protein DPF_2527 [Desulfoplanes formicivorans]